MGVVVNHPVDKQSCPIVSPSYTPSYGCLGEEKRIFRPLKSDPDKKIPIRIAKNELVITTAFGDTVRFSKFIRGQAFHDSRQKKPLSGSECLAEVIRLLDSEEEGTEAFQHLLNV